MLDASHLRFTQGAARRTAKGSAATASPHTWHVPETCRPDPRPSTYGQKANLRVIAPSSLSPHHFASVRAEGRLPGTVEQPVTHHPGRCSERAAIIGWSEPDTRPPLERPRKTVRKANTCVPLVKASILCPGSRARNLSSCSAAAGHEDADRGRVADRTPEAPAIPAPGDQ